jgi:hypothetical protein
MVHCWGVGNHNANLGHRLRFRPSVMISKTRFWKRTTQPGKNTNHNHKDHNHKNHNNNVVYIDTNDKEQQIISKGMSPMLTTLRQRNNQRLTNDSNQRRMRRPQRQQQQRQQQQQQQSREPLIESISMESAKEEEQVRDIPGIRIADTPSSLLETNEELSIITNDDDTPTLIKKRKKRFVRSINNNLKKSKPLAIVRTAEELRSAVLDQKIALENVEFDTPSVPTKKTSDDTTNKKEERPPKLSNADTPELPLDHEVLKVIQQRFQTNSKPGFRAVNDTARLALSIEGGGMRGAVSAGMASAIACLGLCDAFDQIYGSSAGSIIGAYMVSRQMCIDVYTDVLTSSKTAFVSKSRLLSWIAGSLVDQMVDKTLSLGDRAAGGKKKIIKSPQIADRLNPGMNTSFVLDNVLCPESGLRPLDLPIFQENDKLQPLKIVASAVQDGKMETISFSSKEHDFFDQIDETTGMITNYATTSVDGKRHGIFACLDASMTVPAAAGPPLQLIRNKDCQTGITTTCFDAFCYEPIPYRSAVQDGATHVLVLKSRPDGCPIGTKPKAYEKTIAPLYFNSNNLTDSSQFFKVGGQQYIYIEDYLTLDQGKNNPNGGVPVPPTKLLYGGKEDHDTNHLISHREDWKKAHLLPIACPKGTPELSTLSLDKDEVLQAVRGGFSAAFDLLAPSAGVTMDCDTLNSTRIAELVFPNIASPELGRRTLIPGFPILTKTPPMEDKKRQLRLLRWLSHGKSVLSQRILQRLMRRRRLTQQQQINNENLKIKHDTDSSSTFVNSSSNDNKCPVDQCPRNDAKKLLVCLPGLQSGMFSNISKGLQYTKGQV